MIETKSTKVITDYLRGLGIIAVLVTHYTAVYSHDFYASYVSNYANMFLALFFILAGYGAYHSFERRFSWGRSKARVIFAYYVDRALRIYPLYWLALIATAWTSPDYFPVGEISTRHLIEIFTAMPFVDSPLWFVPAIIQCYLFAPLLYLLYKKLNFRKYVYFNLALIAVLLLVSHEFLFLINKLQHVSPVHIPNLIPLLNRGILWGNVFLFSVGLMTPTLLDVYGKLIKSRIVLHVSIIMMILIALILRYDIVERGEDLILMEAGFYFSVLFFCWSMLALKVTGPFEKPVCLFGRYSYSIYLFHDALLLQALFDVHLIQLRLPLSLAIVLALLPVLIWFCVASERVAGNLRLWLWKLGKRTLLASDGSELQS